MKRRLFSLALITLSLAAAVAADKASQNPQSDFRIARLRHVTIFVRDYDEALSWYTNKLGFAKMEDRLFGAEQRWLVVAPAGQKDLGIVLAKAGAGDKGEEPGRQFERVGTTKYWVFDTDDCQKTYDALTARGVKFSQPPKKLPWGTQAIFLDLYGNEFVLLSTRSGS